MDGLRSRVELYRDAVALASVPLQPGLNTFTLAYDEIGASPGAYVLSARATDDQGATSTSAPLHVAVHASPAVTLTAPANNTSLRAPATISLTATATESAATIVKVDFYAGATLIATATTAPYSAIWSNVPAGVYA